MEDSCLSLQTICFPSRRQTSMGRCFSRRIQQVQADGERVFLKQEAPENLQTLKHQQFNKHLVGEGLGIEGGCGAGVQKAPQ